MNGRFGRNHLTGVRWIDLLILLIALAVVFLPQLIAAHWPKLCFLFVPRQKVRAKVVKLQAEIYVEGKEEDLYVHYAWFMTEYGEQLQMPVSEKVYIDLRTDDEGVLTHKGKWFIGFRVTHRAGTDQAIFKDHE